MASPECVDGSWLIFEFGGPARSSMVQWDALLAIETKEGTPLTTVRRLGWPPAEWDAFYQRPPTVQLFAGTGGSLTC